MFGFGVDGFLTHTQHRRIDIVGSHEYDPLVVLALLQAYPIYFRESTLSDEEKERYRLLQRAERQNQNPDLLRRQQM
jgi:hypothetical protein